jgi:hypothetical protein
MPTPRVLLPSLGAALCALVLAPTAGAFKHLDGHSAAQPTATAAKASPHQVLKRAEQAFRRGGDLTPLLKQLADALPHLSPAEKARATSLLARPTDGDSDPQQNGWSAPEAEKSPVCTANFCVHWVETGPDAPPLAGNQDGVPDWVETVAGTAEHVYDVENSSLGWRDPRSDGTRGGGGPGLTDIYLEDVGGSGIYGYAAPDPQPRSHSTFAYLVLDDDFSPQQFPGYANPQIDPLDVTLAHEYNHVLQFTYDQPEDTWMLESTAVWMEGKVYEPVHDYLQYLPGWSTRSTQPITTFNGNDSNDRDNVKVYGSAVWNKWLDQRYGQDVVRDAWEGSVQAKSFAPGAYDRAIRQHGGGGFSKEFSQFAASTAEWQAANSGFPEGSLYPDVERGGTLDVDGSPVSTTLDHTAYVTADVPVSAAPRIRLAMLAPSGTSSAVALVGRTGGSPGGTLLGVQRYLGKGGRGVVTLDNPGGLTRLTAVLINADTKHGGFSSALDDYRFKRNNQFFYAHASTDFSAPTVKGGTFSSKRVTVNFSEPVLGVSGRSLKVAGVSGKVKFKQGTKKATIVLKRALKSGHRYRVKLTSGITDLTLNRLHAVTLTLKA